LLSIWLAAAIGRLTAGGALAGGAGVPVGEDHGVRAGGERQRRGPGEPVAAARPCRGRPGVGGGGWGCGDLAEEVAGAGVRGGGDGDVAYAPCVLVGAAFPVVDLDVVAEDRSAGVPGVEGPAGSERVRGHLRKRPQRDHRALGSHGGRNTRRSDWLSSSSLCCL
jgi:hypothetical protein